MADTLKHKITFQELGGLDTLGLAGILPAFTATTPGLAPASGGGTTAFLRADGTWSAPTVAAAGIVVGSSTVSGGTSGNYAFNNAGVYGEKTPAQVTADLGVFAPGIKGLAPPSGGGSVNFLRADGTWAAPPGGGGSIVVGTTPITGGATGNFLYDNAGVTGERTIAQTTAALSLFTPTLQGLVPLSGGGTLNFLRADGTWVPASGPATSITVGTTTLVSGTSGNYEYNNAGVLGERTPAQVTATLSLFTAAVQGVVAASGGGTGNFLRADGAWVAPPTGGAAT